MRSLGSLIRRSLMQRPVPDQALLESVVHNLKNNRGPGGNEPVGFFPADDESADLVARMRHCGAIRKDDVLVVQVDEAVSRGVRSLYLLRTSAAIERRLAELDRRHGAISVNDVGVCSYPVGDQVIGRPYRTSYLEYTAGVVPPLHYSNYAYIQYLKTFVRSGMSVLDGFAGPGTVGLSLAAECHLERIAFFEYSPAAARMLRSNAARNLPATTRVDIYEGDLFATVPAGEQFDLIVGNPPHNLDLDGRYQNLETVLHIQSFDPTLDIHRRFFAQALSHLRPGGRICLLENGEPGCILQEHLATLLADFADYTLEPPVPMPGSQFYVAMIRRT